MGCYHGQAIGDCLACDIDDAIRGVDAGASRDALVAKAVALIEAVRARDMTELQYRYALRLYTHDGGGSNSLLCDLGLAKYRCPQWYHGAEHRITWATAKEARDYLDVLRARWPMFQRQDIRVVCVVPPVDGRFIEAG